MPARKKKRYTTVLWNKTKEASYAEKIPVSEFHFFQSDDKIVCGYTARGKQYEERIKLSDFILQFDPEIIVRVHQSYAVNMNEVKLVAAGEIKMGEQKIAISKRYRKNFFSLLEDYPDSPSDK